MLTQAELEGTIQLCERLLNRPQTSKEQLAKLSLEELSRLDEELRAQLMKQG